jgi:RNA polymerase sigma-70 factor (ECF subfamily)
VPLRGLISRVTVQPCALARARADPDAFATFYDRYAERVLVFHVRRVLDVDVALDLTSETFAQALERRGQFRGRLEEEEQAWLFALARTQLSRYWRHGRVERAALRRLAVEVPPLADAEVERVEELAGLRDLRPMLSDAIGILPPEQRRAVELRVVGELDYPQVAAAMGVSEQAARARVSRGLRALARELAPLESTLKDTA